MRPQLPKMPSHLGYIESNGGVAMRTVFSIPQHCEHMRSRYPSEPWLAEAAAQGMENLRSLRSGFVLRTLKDMASSGMINLGERQAYDCAPVRKSNFPLHASHDHYIRF
ncbi:uncharacterized protein EI90DRAFT_3050698 [Cantharellus anzutake]|uniref:uncharacterized protein n=1 Tax=Cantharellus anzutake TaxID=1750568 RepID=UPI001904CF28|nr:uncharacterized protein EI90DRAFT_3050698 [Cantharellus anzutake]KAF8334015.1 hypothetical protein EI90DRAFT_3050698 [Cantharellus anzutake]